jgi:hypothetical protein
MNDDEWMLVDGCLWTDVNEQKGWMDDVEQKLNGR